MLGTYFYHQILRKTVVAFGTVFNDIRIRHKSSTSQPGGELRVPLAYGPMQKFLARLEQQPELNRAVQITLPRMSFEMTNISYDPTRKSGITQTFKASDGTNLRKVFMPVPYNIGFELNILVKMNDDALQIVEQILPFFQPSFNLTVDLVKAIGEKRDIPMVLESVTFDDNYDSGYEQKRVITHTLGFTAKTYLFGPVSDSGSGLIKKVQVDYHANTNTKTAQRFKRYVATPRALKDYNDDGVTRLAEDITKTQIKFLVQNTSSLVVDTYIAIGSELMFIKEISGNNITVRRGEDGTTIDTHVNGDTIDAVNAQDDALVELGDDFGFSEQRFELPDFRTYSPTKGVDV